MRKYIDIVDQMLLENKQQYKSMFTKLIDDLKKSPKSHHIHTIGFSEADVDRYIKLARDKFKKKDRIIWFLKQVRQYAYAYMDNFEDIPPATLVDTASPTVILNLIDHFLSLPIPEIQNYQFTDQSYYDVLNYFMKLEEKWKKETQNQIEDDPEDGSEILIDCGEEWYWMNLNKAYCSKESQAMGHCGNSPRQHSDDTILSLRKKITKGDKIFWNPALTFILNDDGYLTEMKGRGNDKPAEKYHPMIVKLLKHSFVKGIEGGGYLPQNNFKLSDLDDDLAKKLIGQKPTLASPYEYYRIIGVDGKLEHLVDDYLIAHDMPAIEHMDKEKVLVGTYTLDDLSSIDTSLAYLDSMVHGDFEFSEALCDYSLPSNVDNYVKFLNDYHLMDKIIKKYPAGNAHDSFMHFDNAFGDLIYNEQEKLRVEAKNRAKALAEKIMGEIAESYFSISRIVPFHGEDFQIYMPIPLFMEIIRIVTEDAVSEDVKRIQQNIKYYGSWMRLIPSGYERANLDEFDAYYLDKMLKLINSLLQS